MDMCRYAKNDMRLVFCDGSLESCQSRVELGCFALVLKSRCKDRPDRTLTAKEAYMRFCTCLRCYYKFMVRPLGDDRI